MAAGVSRPWSTTGERHPRKDKECSPGCGPEPSTPTRPRRPWPGRCQALCCFSTPFPGPSAHLLALSTPAILNGSLCAPQELARKSPDRNAGQRYLLWIQAPLGAVPILWKAEKLALHLSRLLLLMTCESLDSFLFVNKAIDLFIGFWSISKAASPRLDCEQAAKYHHECLHRRVTSSGRHASGRLSRESCAPMKIVLKVFPSARDTWETLPHSNVRMIENKRGAFLEFSKSLLLFFYLNSVYNNIVKVAYGERTNEEAMVFTQSFRVVQYRAATNIREHHQLRWKSSKELEDFHGSQALDGGRRLQTASDREPRKPRGSRKVPVAAEPSCPETSQDIGGQEFESKCSVAQENSNFPELLAITWEGTPALSPTDTTKANPGLPITGENDSTASPCCCSPKTSLSSFFPNRLVFGKDSEEPVNLASSVLLLMFLWKNCLFDLCDASTLLELTTEKLDDTSVLLVKFIFGRHPTRIQASVKSRSNSVGFKGLFFYLPSRRASAGRSLHPIPTFYKWKPRGGNNLPQRALPVCTVKAKINAEGWCNVAAEQRDQNTRWSTGGKAKKYSQGKKEKKKPSQKTVKMLLVILLVLSRHQIGPSGKREAEEGGRVGETERGLEERERVCWGWVEGRKAKPDRFWEKLRARKEGGNVEISRCGEPWMRQAKLSWSETQREGCSVELLFSPQDKGGLLRFCTRDTSFKEKEGGRAGNLSVGVVLLTSPWIWCSSPQPGKTQVHFPFCEQLHNAGKWFEDAGLARWQQDLRSLLTKVEKFPLRGVDTERGAGAEEVCLPVIPQHLLVLVVGGVRFNLSSCNDSFLNIIWDFVGKENVFEVSFLSLCYTDISCFLHKCTRLNLKSVSVANEDLGLGNDKRKTEFKAECSVNGTPDRPEEGETGGREASKEAAGGTREVKRVKTTFQQRNVEKGKGKSIKLFCDFSRRETLKTIETYFLQIGRVGPQGNGQ
eukprot:bmy_07008T0